MTSLQTNFKQVPFEGGSFVTLAQVTLKVLSTDELSVSNGTGALVVAANSFLRDMGRTVVVSGALYRKFLVVGPVLASNGVVGAAPGYLTGYVKLSNGGAGSPDLVARV